ncbi:MAG: GNAT family N-acetyltransferase, partial [Oscillospiraceae bacterium]|nr:GNAT family N-acetyltransferase [Oscillospiraceae bacterium]
QRGDIKACAEILCGVYNNEMWQCRWTIETGTAYLEDYYDVKKFVGFVIEAEGRITGALFAHEKIWWNNSELYVDEMFILPEIQRKGYGSMLIKAAEEYVREHKLAGMTLCTNKYAPAPNFYRKNGFIDNEYIMFMYKETN